jgi:uncharacterized protein (TIGR03435 family)
MAVQRRLVREILEDRFGMRAHIEQREQEVYALRLIKPGVLGRGVVKVDYDCTNPKTRAKRGDVDCGAGDRSEERGAISMRRRTSTRPRCARRGIRALGYGRADRC